MANNSDDWKHKYEKVSDDYDALRESSSEAQKVLCRALVRLTMGVKGLDSSLDPYLARIRDAAKKDCGEADRKKIDELSDQLIRTADVKKKKDPFEVLLGHFSISTAEQKRVLTLWKQMTARPDDVTERMLGEIVEILTGQAAGQQDAPATARKSGFLTRLFAGDSAQTASADVRQDGSGSTHNPNSVLRELLAELDWPNAVKPQIFSLIEKLDDNASADMWIRVISNVNDIVLDALSSFQSEVKSAEQFLAELSRRLQEIDGYVQTAQTLRSESLQSGRALGQTMTEQVDGISNSMRDAPDLATLKVAVAQKLDVIQSHVSRHLADEENRHETADQREQVLKQQLQELETETDQLRREIQAAAARALKDAVTGLPNRQAYDDRLEQEFHRWKRFGEPLAMLVWDIDDFKKINDTYGHQSGDKALRVIAGKLQETLRETDFIARYGGEEFVVLLVGTDLAGAKQVAEKMRKRITQIALKANSERIRMTISGGLSLFSPGDAPEDVFERADQALYKAKRNGKNQWLVG